jgi:hypothetical protein
MTRPPVKPQIWERVGGRLPREQIQRREDPGTALERHILENGGRPDPAGSSYANYLSVITAVSSPNAWAVGYYYNAAAEPLILHWNGSAWKRVASLDPGGSAADNVLYGVTATSSSDAWIAGAYRDTANVYQTLVARWNGTVWQQAASPNTAVSQHNILNSVAATSASNAWSVGFTASASTGTGYQTLILHWNGTGWTDMTSP